MEEDRLMEELYSSNFSVFLGNYGRGKSISMTYLAIMAATLNKRKVVMSNTPLFDLSTFGLEFIPLISTSQFTDNMRDVEIVMDELQKIANSRKSLSPENSFVTEFSTDVRKFNQGIVATAQYGNTYDVRLYDNTEVTIVPEWMTNEKRNRSNFYSKWNLYFMDMNENEVLELNLERMIDYYDTTFKPFKLVCNHEDYILNLEDRYKDERMKKYHDQCEKQINQAEQTFKDCMRGRY